MREVGEREGTKIEKEGKRLDSKSLNILQIFLLHDLGW